MRAWYLFLAYHTVCQVLSGHVVPFRSQAERELTFELGHKPQDDFSFTVSGTMGPITTSRLECEKMEEVQNDCPLQATFSVLNIWDGVISPKVYTET